LTGLDAKKQHREYLSKADACCQQKICLSLDILHYNGSFQSFLSHKKAGTLIFSFHSGTFENKLPNLPREERVSASGLLLNRSDHGKDTPLPHDTLNLNFATMSFDDLLTEGKPKTRTLETSSLFRTEIFFKDKGGVFFSYAYSGIPDGNLEITLTNLRGYGHAAAP
jgi:hypothetical protein